MSYPPPRAFVPVEPAASQRGGNTAFGWRLGATLLASIAQIMMWLPADRFLYEHHKHSASHGSDAFIKAAAYGIIAFMVFGCPAIGTALAPKRAFFVGLLIAAVPGLIAIAQFSSVRRIPDAAFALALAVFVSLAAFVFAVIPIGLIRKRLQGARPNAQPIVGVTTPAADSEAAWPPAPRAF